ncbi:hypothetical protein M758_5G063700 [Ceratodon purpureus]|nr:hypothetical protein M758_5G063700 [Ceratodon purpureus]
MALGMSWPGSWMMAALVILVTVCIAIRNQARGSPKGMASLPLIGDIVQFLRGPREFLLDRLARDGDPFYVSLLGQKITVVNSPEAIKFVLSTAHSSFPGGYTKSFKQLLGEGRFAKPGIHPYNRKAVLTALTGDGLLNLLPFINSLAEKTVKSWEKQPVVNTVEEVSKYVFKVAMHALWRDVDPDSEDMELYRNGMALLFDATRALRINLPGFYFHKAMKTRAMIVSRIQEAISYRRATGVEVDDIFNALLSIKEVEYTDYDICCIMISLMFAGSVTTASSLPFVLKYLHDFPDVRQRVQEEQESIRQKMVEDKSLMWFKPKSSMPYTLQVINEVLRLESIVTFVPRQANKDVDFNGFVFRKGSLVWASTASVQYNPDYFPSPREFNPSRFEEKPKPNTFMVFGQGPHLCPGSELSITESMFLIHHLITNYSWERYGPDQGVDVIPVRKPAGGFLVTLAKRPVS